MDTNVTVRAVLVPGIRHIVLRGRIGVATPVKTEVARAVMTLQTDREHDGPLQ